MGVFMASAGVVFGAWIAFQKSQGNVLGAKAKVLQYSPDGVTWTDTMPTLFTAADMELGSQTTATAYFKKTGNITTLRLQATNPVYTQGPTIGQPDTELISKYIKLLDINVSGGIPLMDQIVDSDADGVKTLYDLLTAQDLPYYDEAAYIMTFELMTTAGDIDELMGDSVSLDLEYSGI